MESNYSNCHRNKGAGYTAKNDHYGDGDVPEVDTNPYYQNVEPLPEASRPRRDGPGGD